MEAQSDPHAYVLWVRGDLHMNDEVFFVTEATMTLLRVVWQHVEPTAFFQIIHEIFDHHVERLEAKVSKIPSSVIVNPVAMRVSQGLQHPFPQFVRH